MRSFIKRFGIGVAGVLIAGTMAVTGMSIFSGSADASTPRHPASFTYVDQSCNSGASGLIAVNALNCNNVEILNDLVDVVGVGLNSR
jgi:hypothetical protein